MILTHLKVRKQVLFLLIIFLHALYTCKAQEGVASDTTLADTLQIGEGKSGYDDLETDGGVGTVKADLVADDAL